MQSRKQSRVYAIYIVGTDPTKQHVCVARLRSVKHTVQLLTDIAVANVRAYATVNGCQYCRNWEAKPMVSWQSYAEREYNPQLALIENDERLDRELSSPWILTYNDIPFGRMIGGRTIVDQPEVLAD